MIKTSCILALSALMSLVTTLHAERILWVSDNGPKGTELGDDGIVRGAFYPAAATDGTPYVDQGFVDLLLAAGHSVTRFNPNSTVMSTNDVPLINSYDLIILGAALNSGPFNLNARGAKWNTQITKPMIVTKSTLIRRDRMGYLIDNKEFDCAADASTTASGKLTLLNAAHPIFDGIARSAVGGSEVMDNHSVIRVASPANNRGASVQYFKLLIDGADQAIVNTVEPGGVVLASMDFNPLDPGVNIPAGQAPAVFGSHVATGYAIVEWPAGTVVRTTQVEGETIASYRLLFACGTRDASGSVTASPNPQAGAMDLSPDGQRMFLNAVKYAAAQNPKRILSSTWGEWDYKQYLYGGIGNLVLSNQTSSGFTAWVATNDVDVLNNTTLERVPDGAIEVAGRPAVFQEFSPLDLSEVGQKVTATFDLKINNPLVWSDQFVRFGFGNTNNNSCFYLKIDSGLGGGDVLGFRSDATMTDTNGQTLISATFDPNGNLATATNLNVPVKGPSEGFVSGNYSHFINSGGLNPPGSSYPQNIGGGAYPNGVGLGVEGTLDVIHTISLSMERVAGGLKIVGTWSNSAGADLRVSGYTSPYIDTELPAGHGRLDKISSLGFNLMSNDLFTNGYAGGTYTVSNFNLDYVVPPPFRITHIAYVPELDGLTFTWDSRAGETYILEYSTNFSDWQQVPNTTVIESQGDSTTLEYPFAEQNTFYRIRKQ
jgi:hypothetical protein